MDEKINLEDLYESSFGSNVNSNSNKTDAITGFNKKLPKVKKISKKKVKEQVSAKDLFLNQIELEFGKINLQKSVIEDLNFKYDITVLEDGEIVRNKIYLNPYNADEISYKDPYNLMPCVFVVRSSSKAVPVKTIINNNSNCTKPTCVVWAPLEEGVPSNNMYCTVESHFFIKLLKTYTEWLKKKE